MRADPEGMKYCFKFDCRKFYPSIAHDVLKRTFRRKYKDKRLLALMDEIIDSISTCPATPENISYYKSKGLPCNIINRDGEQFIDGVGIPIGNYFSQYDGNFILSAFDHYCKEVLHIKHIYRYMDDVCIYGSTKEELHEIRRKVVEYLDNNLWIRVKDNWQIFPADVRGVDFVGYRIFRGYVLLRKSTCQSMEKRMQSILIKCQSGKEMTYSDWCAIASYQGWLKYCDGHRLSVKYLAPLKPYAEQYYQQHIKPKKGEQAA